MERIILHSDINNCYASIELLHRPALRGKPVVVGGNVEERHGIVLAKNDIAKKFGIKTGMLIWQAMQLCPGLVSVPPNYPLYLRFARLARAIYADYTDLIMPFGIDENWLDVTGSIHLLGSGKSIADDIRRRMQAELGITVSIGVSFNKIFAKLGSDMRKPNYTTVITKENFREQVWQLPASDLLYVGPATARKLQGRAISTIGQLAQTNPDYLRRVLGKPGEMLWSFANGYDNSPVLKVGEEAMIKSIGNSTTTPRDLECEEDVRLTFYVLAESVAARLRESALRCRTVQISVRDNQLCSFERQSRLAHPTCLAADLVEAGMRLFRANYRWHNPIRSLGIRGMDLEALDGSVQLSLLWDAKKHAQMEVMEHTVDHLRGRFGFFSLQRASMLCDPELTGLDAKSDHTIHPVSYLF